MGFAAALAILVGVALISRLPPSEETSARSDRGVGAAASTTLEVSAQHLPAGEKSIYETFPALCAAVDLDDARATWRALRREGFAVRWDFIPAKVLEGAAGASSATGYSGAGNTPPPPGSVVISVLSEEGAYTGVSRTDRALLLEVSTDRSSHPGGRDIGCV